MTSPIPTTLTGQDVGEAEGALTALLGDVLSRTGSGMSRAEYITLRVVAARGAALSPVELCKHLASQPQLGLDQAQVSRLLEGLAARGVVSASTDSPVQLTRAGAELYTRVGEAVAAATGSVYAEIPQADLVTAHRVLVEVTQRANRLRGQF